MVVVVASVAVVVGREVEVITVVVEVGVLGVMGLVAMIALTAIFGTACPQWLWAVVGGTLLFALLFGFVGIQGMYLGRMYDELKDRPLYIVAETLNTDEN